MKNIGVIIFCLAVLSAVGCGGPGASQQSSVNLEMVILNVEGEFFIQGIVYNDLDGDGEMDLGEPGIPGVVVTLVTLDATVTDTQGHYAFSVTTSGTYTVEETDPSGYLSTTPNSIVVQITDQAARVDFGDSSEITTYSIYGTVFDDLDLDGIMGTGEPGIPDVVVTVDGVGEMVTSADGTYAFGLTITGYYTVTETDPEGYISTTPNEEIVEIVADSVMVNFGDRAVADMPVDVKPGSDINPVNLRSKGVLPVAVLGSADLDVSQIDPGSLLLNGVVPLRWNFDDICSSDGGDVDLQSEGDEVNTPDGYTDLTLKFSTQEIAAALGDVKRGDFEKLTMTGYLLDGTPASGEQMVWIVQVQK